MFRRGCVAACTFAFLLIGVAVTGAAPTHQERQTTATSPFRLPHPIEGHERQFSGRTHANTGPLWDAQGSRTQLRKCQSKRKGVFIGAAIGTAIAGAFAVYVVKDLSGNVLGTTQGSSRYVAYWMVGGAAAGALGGFAYCR